MWLFLLYPKVFQCYYSLPSSKSLHFNFCLVEIFSFIKKNHVIYCQTEYAGLFIKIEYRVP